MNDDPQNDPQEEAAPQPDQPAEPESGQSAPAVPAQESFGQDFPIAPPVENGTPAAENVTTPPAYNAQPEQPAFMPPPQQPAYNPYGSVPAYPGAAPYGYSAPPQGAYGAPPNDFPIPPASPLPLGQAIRQLPKQYWRILTKPKAQVFAEEQGKAAWNIIWAQLLFLGLVDLLFVGLIVLLEFFLFQVLMPANMGSFFSSAIPAIVAIAIPVTFAWVIGSFFAGVGILHLLARAFGGEGRFLSYAYGYTLVTIPIGILSIALSIIPCIGSMAGLAGAVYSTILLIYMTMGVHRLKGGKASAVVLIPIGTMIILVIGAYVAYFVFIFSMLSSMPHP